MDSKYPIQWYVMRDLKRPNARQRAYEQLESLGFTVFTPKVSQIVVRQGKKVRMEVPYIPDLFFVRCSRDLLDPIVESERTLQYRWNRHKWREPLTVSEADMDRFMQAVAATPFPRYYHPSEITPQMYNRRIRIIGGLLDGQEGTLVTTRGSKVKRLLVEIPGLLAVSVEIRCEYIEVDSD